MHASSPDVTVCIPAYRAATFVEQTLRSVAAQTYGRFRATVSVDASDDGTAEACRRFAAHDARFSVVEQPRRLGWVGNVNALLDAVDTEFFCILPHDDSIAPDYVEALRALLRQEAPAVLAFADFDKVTAPEPGWDLLAGPPGDRLLALLAAPRPGMPWRGLTRSWVLRDGRRMRGEFDGFEAHILWLIELLCLGPFAHLPRPLYHGGPPRRSVTRGWASWPTDRKIAAGIEHAMQCLRIVAGAAQLGDERYALALACAIRALHRVRQARGEVRVELPSRHDDLVLLAGLLGRALGFAPLDEAGVAALRQSPAPRRMMTALLLADARRSKAAGERGAEKAARREAILLAPAGGQRGQAAGKDTDAARSIRRSQALRAAESTAQLTPRDPLAVLELARHLAKAGQLGRAHEMIERTLLLDPDLSAAYHLQALLFRRQRRYDKALVAARTALNLDAGSRATRTLVEDLLRRDARRRED